MLECPLSDVRYRSSDTAPPSAHPFCRVIDGRVIDGLRLAGPAWWPCRFRRNPRFRLSRWRCRATPGLVAQLGERLLCKQEVDGSSPFTSTSLAKQDWWASGETQFRRKPPPPMKAQLSSRGGSAYRADRGLRQQTLKGEVPKARHQLYHPLRRGSGTELAPKLLYWETGVGC